MTPFRSTTTVSFNKLQKPFSYCRRPLIALVADDTDFWSSNQAEHDPHESHASSTPGRPQEPFPSTQEDWRHAEAKKKVIVDWAHRQVTLILHVLEWFVMEAGDVHLPLLQHSFTESKKMGSEDGRGGQRGPGGKKCSVKGVVRTCA